MHVHAPSLRPHSEDPTIGVMLNHFRRLLDVLGGSTQADLCLQIQYQTAEKEVDLAKIGGPVRVTPEDRSRLVYLAEPFGSTVKTLPQQRGSIPRCHREDSVAFAFLTRPVEICNRVCLYRHHHECAIRNCRRQLVVTV